MDEFLGYSYKLSKSENFDEFMKALGVNFLLRKIANTVSPVVKLTKKDGVYTLHTSSTFRNEEINFKPDVEFEEETPDGRKVKTVVQMYGNKMFQTQTGEENITVIIRDFSSQEMKATFKVGDIACKRIYERVK